MQPRKFIVTCRECGGKAHVSRPDARFCSSACKAAFNNRRAMRGAQLYDLMMANRHERGVAKLLGIWTLITRLTMYWREQDVAERGGRRSWVAPQEAVEANNWANATVVNRNAAGARR